MKRTGILWLSLAMWGCAGSPKPPPNEPAVVENRPASPPAEETGVRDGASEEPVPMARRPVVRPAAATQPSSPPPAAYNPNWQTGIGACDDYSRMMAVCIESPTFPEAARQQTRDALAQMQQAWSQVTASGPEALRAISDACVQAIQAMSQAADAVCPGVFPPPPPQPPARP